jgi:hypothetical protein
MVGGNRGWLSTSEWKEAPSAILAARLQSASIPHLLHRFPQLVRKRYAFRAVVLKFERVPKEMRVQPLAYDGRGFPAQRPKAAVS